MTQLLSGLHTQGILCQETVRGAEVGLEKGEETSSLQRCYFDVAAMFYTGTSLYWCIVEICFVKTEFFYKNQSLSQVFPSLVCFTRINTQKLLRKCAKNRSGITFASSWLFPFSH